MLVASILIALIITIVVEASVAALMGYRSDRELKYVVIVNVITDPIINLVIFYCFARYQTPMPNVYVAALDIIVIVVEWKLLVKALRYEPFRLFKLSAVMNTVAFFCGLLLNCPRGCGGQDRHISGCLYRPHEIPCSLRTQYISPE